MKKMFLDILHGLAIRFDNIPLQKTTGVILSPQGNDNVIRKNRS